MRFERLESLRATATRVREIARERDIEYLKY